MFIITYLIFKLSHLSHYFQLFLFLAIFKYFNTQFLTLPIILKLNNSFPYCYHFIILK